MTMTVKLLCHNLVPNHAYFTTRCIFLYLQNTRSKEAKYGIENVWMGRIDKRENGNMEKEKLDAHQHQIWSNF